MILQAAFDRGRATALLEGYTDLQAPGASPVEKGRRPGIGGMLFERTGIPSEQQRGIVYRLLSEAGVAFAIAVISASIIPAGAGAGIIAAEILVVRRKAQRRELAFERDYVAMLLALASSIRTGLDPLAALLDIPKLFASGSELSKEISRVRHLIESGATEEAAVGTFGGTFSLPDCRLFVSAFLLSRREGSSLAECLQRLAKVTRQRQSFRRKIRSAVAMQKLSCVGIGLSAMVIGIVQVVSNPKALLLAASDPAGSRLLLGGAALVAGGVVWMLKLSTPRI